MHMPVPGSHLKVLFDSMISYLFLFSMGPGISPIWGNVEPHFVIIFGIKITYINKYFAIIFHILCHADRYSARGKNKFIVYKFIPKHYEICKQRYKLFNTSNVV